MSVCKNCKYYNVCGSNKRTQECKGKELKLNIQMFGGRGASSSSSGGASGGTGVGGITPGDYTYKDRGFDLSVRVVEKNKDKLLVRIVGRGENGSFFDGSPQTISINSPLAKGMKKSRQ